MLHPVVMLHLVFMFHRVAGVGDLVDKAELERIASAVGLFTEFADFTILSQRLDSQIAALCGTSLLSLALSALT